METNIYSGTFANQEAFFIENDLVKATVLPRLGAKIASLVYKPQDFEVFFRPTSGAYSLPQYGADFAEFDTSGADEMFPTIDACDYPDPGSPPIACPDHGELWSIPWQAAIDTQGDALATETTGVALNYRFQRTLTLSENCLRFDYALKNTGTRSLLGFWAFHGLVACDEHTRITLPKARQTRTCQVLNVKEDDRLGPAGGVFDFPEHQLPDGVVDLGGIRPVSKTQTRKYYVNGPVAQGQCSMTLNRRRLEYRVAFPEDKVPYLGLWIDEGGFKNEYNCALEPAEGFYDSLKLAHQNQSITPLSAGETRTWWMEIALSNLT